MQVILKRDVARLGKAGDIVKVKDGYARNYLIPKGFAVPATKGFLREQKNLNLAKKQKQDRLLAEAKEQAAKLSGKTLVFYAKAGQGRIFGSITAKEIANKIRATYKISVDKRRVLLDKNLKELGLHPVEIQLHPEVRVKITVEIRAEEG